MASGMLTGDRRWGTTTRKSGMTVLGKVPKPLNLPSLRLENHGVDPNVEIVPKGMLTWGSRPSLAAPNAWGTASISPPNTDGSAGSPSHCPSSSGGSGTRPSTAGSDRSHETVSSAWGPNSRPLSASGILASSQISAAAATRPRSAETRPGSSQLSRFADNSVDNTVAWGAAGAAERGTASSKSSGFTLSSGDFPTLGSDKNSDTHSQRGHSSQGRPQSSQGRPQSSQGRPPSASGIDLKPKEPFEPHLAGNRSIDHLDHGTVNTWKADNPPFPGHGASPNMDNWHRDPHSAPPYPNMNMPPPHYDSWHNPSFHPADGSWYRGGAAGSPYRSPGPPGSYPVDYPHVSGRPLSNPQFSRQDAGPGGLYNNSDSYRPCMPPERYMGPSHPDIPVRPGPYPGPVVYDGYYGPPHSNFYNSTERESSIMGMARPIVHNQHPIQHQNYNSNFHARPSGYATVMNKEQPKPNQALETQGQYRVLLKQHDGSEDCDEQEKRERSVTAGSHVERGNRPGGFTPKGDGETKSQALDIALPPNLPWEAVSCQSISGLDGHSTDTAVRNLAADSGKAADEGLFRSPEAANVRSRDLQQHPVIKKNATLLEKVESLNNKARIADSHSEGGPISSKGKPASSKDVTIRADQSINVACASDNSSENAVPDLNMETAILNKLNASAEDENQESTIDRKAVSVSLNYVGATENQFVGQKKVGTKSADNRAKLRSNRHDNDEWMKRPPGSESSMNTPRTSVKDSALESDASKEAPETELSLESGCVDGSLMTSSLDPVDHKAQRAKMREIAMQRAKQLQMEEEERTREQKAKAHAKLEELNRRTLAESSNLKPNHASLQSSDDQNNNQESGPGATSIADTTCVEASSGTSACQPEIIKHVDDSGIERPAFSSDLSSNVVAHASCPSMQSSVVLQPQSLHQGQSINAPTKTTLVIDPTKTTLVITSDIQHDMFSKQKQVGYRKKHGIPQENIMGGKQRTAGSVGSPKHTGEIAVSESSKDNLPSNDGPPLQHKKKNNRNSRNNNNIKLDEGQTSSTFPSALQMEGNSDKPHVESERTNPSTLVAEATSVPSESLKENVDTLMSREVPDIPVKEVLPETTEETRGRVSNQWKPQPQRKIGRNQQAIKPVSKYHASEAVMWAPVKPSSKSETSDEARQHSMTEATKPSGKSGQDLQNGLKAKRAEMERYVPKPIAKELFQQVNSQQTSSSLSETASGDMTGKSETGSPSFESGKLDGLTGGKSAVASDFRSGENNKHNKHNKHGRTNASWRQRSSAESLVQGSMPSDHVKAIQMTSDQVVISNIDNLPKGQLTHTDDGWNDSDNVLPSETVTSTVVSKSYGGNSQGRQTHKVQRVSGSNYPASDNIDSQQGVTDKSKHRSAALSRNELEGRNITRTESQNAGVENVTPHWQPKSQVYGHGRQGNRGTRGGYRGTSQSTEHNLTMNEDSNSSNQRTTVAEVREACHLESRRERRVAPDPAKEQTATELAPNFGYQREQTVPFGANQRGQYNGRFQRGYDTTYRGQEGQDTSRQNFHTNGDKRKNNPHVEYQRIGYNDKSADSFQQNPNAGEGPHEASRAHGSRYRERGGQYQRGGGQFYGRGAATTAPVGNSYNSGD